MTEPQVPAAPTPPEQEGHPERARPSRESKDPHKANSENGSAGNSPVASQKNGEKASSENIPPLTNRQTPAATTPPEQESHPERARSSRESKDPHKANSENGSAGNSPVASEKNGEKAGSENIPPLTNRQTESWDEIKKLEASIEGAMRGSWRDLRTVFNAVGLTPRKPPTSHKVASHKKVRGE